MQYNTDLESALRDAEVESVRLAARGRLVAISIFAVYSVVSFTGALLVNTLVHLAAFALIAGVLLASAPVTHRRPWIKYVLVALEVAILAEAVLTPNPFNPDPWPPAMVFRYDNFYYFFALIAVSVFSYSPRLVAWAGICTAIAWGIGVAFVMMRGGGISFSEAAADAETSRDVLELYLEPNVVLLNGRIKEIVTALLVSSLLAVVVWRGRRAVLARLAVEGERRLLNELFGRYVPQQVADAIVRDQGTLQPEERVATVLFADIEGFTATVERMAPRDALNMLNDYFQVANEIMGRHNGVITQFQGDAILASFNVPVASHNHAAEAVQAAEELLAEVARRDFGGERLKVRVGINTGPVVAGSVGGTGRQLYTVHGDAVNLAARLEQLNKTLKSYLLISESTRELLEDQGSWRAVANQTVRGRRGNVAIFSLDPAAAGS